MGMQFMRKRAGGGGNAADTAGAFEDDGFKKKYPALFEFLAEAEWEAGSPRVTGTLFIFVEGSNVKACVSDRDSGFVAFVSGSSWEKLLASVEKGLAADTLDWRPGKDNRRSGRK